MQDNDQTIHAINASEDESQSADNRSNSPFAPGDIVGGTYKVIDFLGQGGMGFVYRVEHLLMAKPMALKVLRADQVSESVWKRFQTEAQAIARLNHPNIVKIYDMNQTPEGLPFYTMDLLIGQSLADVLDSEDFMMVQDALPIFRQVCAGLAYAHEHGIIHRDVKPANIMLLDDKKTVKIVDFGIAKLNTGNNQNLTRPGEVFGSPLYMSPEQCLGQSVDHRTDIYSVGCTLFEALTGRAPFIGRTAIETILMHQTETAPLLEDFGEEAYSEGLEKIIAELLEKDPDRRYQSLADAASDLLKLERIQFSDSARFKPADSAEISAETATEGDSNRSFLLPMMLTVTFSALLILVGLSMSLKTRLSPQAKKPDGKQERFEPESEQEIARARIKQIAPLYAAAMRETTPLSEVIGTGPTAVRRFKIPAGIDLGTIKTLPLGQTQRVVGTFDLPENQDRELTSNFDSTALSGIFKRFKTGDFQSFSCQSIDGASDQTIADISHINSILNVRAGNTDITNASLKYFEKIQDLQGLGVTETKISGDALAKTSLPQRLTALSMFSGRNAHEVISAMRNSKKALHLNFGRCQLTRRDVEILATMPRLRNLEIEYNDLDDSDLQPLARLANLQTLELKGCKRVTVASISTFQRCKALTQLSLSFRGWTKSEKERLCKALPHLMIYSGEIDGWLQRPAVVGRSSPKGKLVVK